MVIKKSKKRSKADDMMASLMEPISNTRAPEPELDENEEDEPEFADDDESGDNSLSNNPRDYQFRIRGASKSRTWVEIWEKKYGETLCDLGGSPSFLPSTYNQEMESVYSIKASVANVKKELKAMGLTETVTDDDVQVMDDKQAGGVAGVMKSIGDGVKSGRIRHVMGVGPGGAEIGVNMGGGMSMSGDLHDMTADMGGKQQPADNRKHYTCMNIVCNNMCKVAVFDKPPFDKCTSVYEPIWVEDDK